MQPSQPQGFDPNQFDFIMNPQQNAKKGLGFGSNKKPPILMMVLFVGFVLIVVAILYSLIFGGNSSGSDRLLKLAQQQQEVIRITDKVQSKLTTSRAQTLATITKATLISDQKQTTALLSEQGKKVGNKELGITASSKTDTTLTQAESNGRLDDTYIQVTTDLLTEYRRDLQAALAATSSKKTQSILRAQSTHLDLIGKAVATDL